ncbi:MAG: phosphohydrolase [Methanoculleus sp. SDB]|nr:MAG: phosphohydrolase [Methanoculleus sp. SDB]
MASFEEVLEHAGCERRVIEHCRAVAGVALTFTLKVPVNTELVLAGAWLHDIGRSKTHGIAHGQIGADICRELGYSERIARIVECHIGAGLTREECRRLGLEPRDCVPSTLEEKIVAHADNIVKDAREISIDECIARAAPLGPDVQKRLRDLADEIERLR